ncbi:MAG: exodeoxyribonuclease VII small subunit [Chloroflexota bacterium]|nr:exodeoxyribonuclease VII small subunit [Dehalococcoidia bacterium]MDW8253664.1 exodeoxyribonuclease VII small subunit [Chloroflexota bacterium]
MTNDVAPLTFEAAFAQLQAIVQRLEEGGLELEEAMGLYEQGMRLVKTCATIIETAELRLVQLQDETDLPPR